VVPTDTLDTVPVVLIVATDGLVLLHTPPSVASDKAVVYPLHIVGVPVIADNALTVIGKVVKHPVGKV
jgi:hypothetical protein